MRRERLLRNPLIRISSALVFVALAAASRITPLHSLESSLPWVTFYPAVILAALVGGVSVGLLSTGLSIVTVALLWPLFAPSPFLRTPAQWTGVAVFLCTGCMISAVCEGLRRAQMRIAGYRTLVRSMNEGFCVIELLYNDAGMPVDYRFEECNGAFEKETGLADATKKTIRQLSPGHESHWFETYGKVASTGEEIRFESRTAARDKDLDVFAFRIGGKGSRRVGLLIRDITARKKQEQELKDAALYDQLTGLANREMFQKYLSKALARAGRSGQILALLYIDLDGFKVVNDTYGHQAGDHVLQLVAQRLVWGVRNGDLVSRLGGDEFAIILENCQPGYWPVFAERFVRALEAPMEVAGGTARISASIGIATYPECAIDEMTLITKADATMYAVKRNGKNGFKLWESSIASVDQ